MICIISKTLNIVGNDVLNFCDQCTRYNPKDAKTSNI